MRSTLTWSAGLLPFAALLASCTPAPKYRPNANIAIDIDIRCVGGHVMFDLDWKPHVTHGFSVTWRLHGTGSGNASSASLSQTSAGSWGLGGTLPYTISQGSPVSVPANTAGSYSYAIDASCTDAAGTTYHVKIDPDIVVD